MALAEVADRSEVRRIERDQGPRRAGIPKSPNR
jgi:hypothetical protein